MAHLIIIDEPVNRGEWRMLEYFRELLPDDWYVLGSLHVSVGDRTREIDSIVIGSRFIWVVDAKNFWGVIRGDEHEWILNDGTFYPRVLDNVMHAAAIVKGKVSKKLPHLKDIWVEGLIVLTNPAADLQILDDRARRHVLSLKGCENYFRNAHPHHSIALSLEDRTTVARSLIGHRAFSEWERREPPRFVGLRLDGLNGFRRIYYEDALIDRNELRGALPPKQKSDLPGAALIVRFESGGVFMSVQAGSCSSQLRGEPLKPGTFSPVLDGDNRLQIGSLDLKATVFTSEGELA